MSLEDRIFWMTARQALLTLLDGLEKRLGISPTTAEIRALARRCQNTPLSPSG